MKFLGGAVVGGLIVAALAFMWWKRPLDQVTMQIAAVDTPEELKAAADAMKRAKPRYATITLEKGPTARCLATISNTEQNGEMGGHPGERVTWTIAHKEDNECFPSGPWAVWLVFEGSELPFNERDVRVGREKRTMPIKADARYGNRRYKVWMRGHNMADYELIDPDLEVEDPPRVIK